MDSIEQALKRSLDKLDDFKNYVYLIIILFILKRMKKEILGEIAFWCGDPKYTDF